MDRVFKVIIEQDSEGCYVATVHGLRDCRTRAESLDILMDRAREAIALCLQAEGEDAGTLGSIRVQWIAI